MPDEKQPGAVPQFVAPQHQVTAPLPIHQGPWMYPPPPPHEPKKEEHGGIKLAIQIIMATLALGGVIFAGGAAREKLSHIEENQRAAETRAAEQKRQQDERDEKLANVVGRLERKVDRLSEQRQDTGGRRRRREAADQVLPPGP
jgi:uncharacterized protein HemX